MINDLYQHLDQQVDTLSTRYAEHIQCKAGCSGCCINGFKVRYNEALIAFEGLMNQPTEVIARVLQQLKSPEPLTHPISIDSDKQEYSDKAVNSAQKSSKACPLLLDNQCSIYASRPALCRAFGVTVQLDDTVATCELNFQNYPKDGTIHVLDVRPYYNALDEHAAELWKAKPLPLYKTEQDDGLEGSPPRLSLQEWFSVFLKHTQQHQRPPE